MATERQPHTELVMKPGHYYAGVYAGQHKGRAVMLCQCLDENGLPEEPLAATQQAALDLQRRWKQQSAHEAKHRRQA